MALLLVLCVAALPAAPALGADGPRPGSPEKRLLDLVNAERARRGQRRVLWDEELARLARDHAEDLRRTGRVSHQSSSDGADFNKRLVRSGYRARAAAENVAYDRNVESAHAGLMESPGHRANILAPELASLGVGIVPDRDGDSIYVVEDFATPIVSLTDQEAGRRVRQALEGARNRAALPPLEEDRALSRQLEKRLRELVAADSVKVKADILPRSGWIGAYTTHDPMDLPKEAKARLSGRRAAQGYGVAITYARSASSPLGMYWVVLGLLD